MKTFFFGLHLCLDRKTGLILGEKIFILILVLLKFSEFSATPTPPPLSKSCVRYWAHLCVIAPGNTASFEEILQRWRAVGNTVSDLTSPRFEPQTSRSKDECVTARKPLYSIILQRILNEFQSSIQPICANNLSLIVAQTSGVK